MNLLLIEVPNSVMLTLSNLLTVLVSVTITNFLNKREKKATIDNVISDTYSNLLTSCMSEIERLKLDIEDFRKLEKEFSKEKESLEKENEGLRYENTELKGKVATLEKEMKEVKKRLSTFEKNN